MRRGSPAAWEGVEAGLGCPGKNINRIDELLVDFIQWPAMAVTVAAAWGAGSHLQIRRRIGFWLFLVSNVLWVAWGWWAEAWALVVLQIFLAGTNLRGAQNNDPDENAP
jgi:hypothetical protein